MEFDCSFFSGPKPGKDATWNSAQITLLTGYIFLSRLPEAKVLFVSRIQLPKLFVRRAKDGSACTQWMKFKTGHKLL